MEDEILDEGQVVYEFDESAYDEPDEGEALFARVLEAEVELTDEDQETKQEEVPGEDEEEEDPQQVTEQPEPSPEVTEQPAEVDWERDYIKPKTIFFIQLRKKIPLEKLTYEWGYNPKDGRPVIIGEYYHEKRDRVYIGKQWVRKRKTVPLPPQPSADVSNE
jgi:hypothetical protein